MQASNETNPVAGRIGLTVALCCLVAVMEGIDLQTPGVTAPVLGVLFKMSPDQKGWFLTTSTFGLMIGAAIGGRLSDRIGRKWVLILAAALFGLFSILTALSTSANMLMVMRFLTGLGLGGVLPNIIALAAETVSPAKRYTALGFLYAGLPAGGGVASLVSAFASAPGQWPVVYLVGGVAPLLIVPLLIVLLPNRKPAELHDEAASTPNTTVFNALFGEGRAARTLLLWVGFFGALLITYLLLGWMPSLMAGRGLSHAQASTVQLGFNWFAALGGAATGVLLDRGKRPLIVALVFAAATAALIYLAGAPGDFGLSFLAGSLAGVTQAGIQTVLYSMGPNCYPARVRGAGVGFAVAAGRFGSAAGPLLAGFLLGAGRSADQVLISLVPIIVCSAVCSVIVASMTKELVA